MVELWFMKILKTKDPEIRDKMVSYGWGYIAEKQGRSKVYCFVLLDDAESHNVLLEFPSEKYYIDDKLCF